MPPRKLLQISRVTALVAFAALLAAACGSGSSEPTALVATDKNTAPPPAVENSEPIGPVDPQGSQPANQESAPVTAPNDLPPIEVTNVVNGEQLSLASLVPSDRPLLLWFWAPH